MLWNEVVKMLMVERVRRQLAKVIYLSTQSSTSPSPTFNRVSPVKLSLGTHTRSKKVEKSCWERPRNWLLFPYLKLCYCALCVCLVGKVCLLLIDTETLSQVTLCRYPRTVSVELLSRASSETRKRRLSPDKCEVRGLNTRNGSAWEAYETHTQWNQCQCDPVLMKR